MARHPLLSCVPYSCLTLVKYNLHYPSAKIRNLAMDGPGYQSLCQHPRGPTICEAAEFFAVASALLTAGQSSLACLRPRGRRPFDRAPTDMAAAAEFLPSMVGRNSCPRLADHLRQLRQLPRSPPRPAGSSNCPNSNRRRQGHDPPIAAGVPPPHPPPLVSGPGARDQFGHPPASGVIGGRNVTGGRALPPCRITRTIAPSAMRESVRA